MKNITKYSLSFVIVFATFSVCADEHVTLSEQQKIAAQSLIDDALDSDLAYGIVESLTTEVGPRMAGSESEQRAREWGEELGHELGFDRVSVEKFTMPYWHRGDLSISLTKPYQQELYGTALGGGAASKGLLTSDVVYFRSINDLEDKPISAAE